MKSTLRAEVLTGSVHIPADYVDKRTAARFTTLSVRSIDYARSRGDLPFYRVGRRVLFSLPDLRQWMSRFRVDPTSIGIGANVSSATAG